MNYDGIVITGTSGSGKSTIVNKICKENSSLKKISAVTTREFRDDDEEGSYEYLNEEEFQELKNKSSLLINTEYRSKQYGIKESSLQSVLSENKVPVLVITPKSAVDIGTNSGKYNFFTVFIDAKDETLDQRLSDRNRRKLTVEPKEQINMQREDQNYRDKFLYLTKYEKEQISRQRKEDREYRDEFLYSIENDSVALDDICQLITSLWEYKNSGGMLSKRLITLMINCGMLLLDADTSKVSGASYDLRLGDQYIKQKKTKELSSIEPFLIIEPGDCVIASAKEIANFPKDIAARFDLSVGLFCQGIILSNGPQVDPGFRGGLFCLLFNTSNKPVQLRKEDHYATIEFIKLLEPTDNYKGKYQDRKSIIDYLPREYEKSEIWQVRKELEQLEKNVKNEKSLPLILAFVSLIITILVAASTITFAYMQLRNA